MLFPMDVVALTRQLVDIESITGNEALIGDVVHSELLRLGYQANKLPVEGTRRNVYATSPQQPKPTIVFSTHMDTVPPFIPSSEDATRIYGRGSCDAKGIIAAQIAAAERLRAEGIYVGLLFLVGEERNSLGAQVANKQSPGCKFLVNGEPTENRMASASKGTLRVNVIAEGRMAHSAYPELGESAIDKLLEALNRLARDETARRRRHRSVHPEHRHDRRRPCSQCDSGQSASTVALSADRAHRRITRERLSAQLQAWPRSNSSWRSHSYVCARLDGLPTMVAAFTTDIPALTNWGEPLLIGPGSIHVAHTEGEYIEKEQLSDAVDLYCAIAKRLAG